MSSKGNDIDHWKAYNYGLDDSRGGLWEGMEQGFTLWIIQRRMKITGKPWKKGRGAHNPLWKLVEVGIYGIKKNGNFVHDIIFYSCHISFCYIISWLFICYSTLYVIFLPCLTESLRLTSACVFFLCLCSSSREL